MTDSTQQDFDLIIVGGGLIGSSLALALAPCGLKILLIEKFAPNHQQQPSFDERTVALTWSSRQIFNGIGVWQKISAEDATAIKDIHVSHLGQPGVAHLDRKHIGTEALGYVVPARVIGKNLYECLNNYKNVTVACPEEAVSFVSTDGHVALTLASDETTVTGSLLVVADGGRSKLLENLELDPVETPYPQTALLTIIDSDRPHKGRAYERFTVEGPLALLPYQKNRYAVVWTSLPENVPSRMALSDYEFCNALQETFGDRAGRFSNPTARKSYPLKKSSLGKPNFNRGLVIGNAAHTVHPVAGQGFNLGLRSVAELAESIASQFSAGDDIGSPEMIEGFVSNHQGRVSRVQQFTHNMISVFSSDDLALKILRGKALSVVESCPPIKKLLLQRTMGLAGAQSRLARGLSLS